MAEPSATIISRQDARTLGLTHFFTGIQCRHGHLDVRYTCNAQCKMCRLEAERKWIAKNPARNARNLQWYYLNHKREKEKQRERNRIYRRKLTATQKRDRSCVQLLWRKKNRKYIREVVKRWRANNPLRVRKQASDRRARKLAAPGSHTLDDIAAIFLAQGGRCAGCGILLTVKTRTVDHITPLSRGGSNDKRNLQIMCRSCNSSKRARDAIEFSQSRGLLL
jgi:5-methylcytosine-specific restriction endonuclease McrA